MVVVAFRPSLDLANFEPGSCQVCMPSLTSKSHLDFLDFILPGYLFLSNFPIFRLTFSIFQGRAKPIFFLFFSYFGPVNTQGSAERSGPINSFYFFPLSWVCWAFRPAFSNPAAQSVHPNALGLLCTPPLDSHREKGEACPWPTDRQDPQDVVGLRLSHWRQFNTVAWTEPCRDTLSFNIEGSF